MRKYEHLKLASFRDIDIFMKTLIFSLDAVRASYEALNTG